MSIDRYILDDDGNPVPCPDLYEWGEWMGTQANRQLAKTDVGEYRVSTVFLGLDHSYMTGPPILWETMIFAHGRSADDYQERYATRAAALEGHTRAVKRAMELASARTPT